MKKNIVIIHYNTPLLTECLVRSINLFVKDAIIYIFDNSDKYPFTAFYDNVLVLDNTKGEIINFDKWLENYPNRHKSGGKRNYWGSAKHCYSVEKCMEIIKESFVLMDSDILLKKDISDLFKEDCIYVGEPMIQPTSNTGRLLPFLCFINTEMCQKEGIHYFDDNYMHGLRKTPDGDRYDTGGIFLKNASKFKHQDVGIYDYMIHYNNASWMDTTLKKHSLSPTEWVKRHKRLWNNEKNKNVIYTCITNGYDGLIEPTYVSDNFDYVCFTDNSELRSDIWDIRPLPKETEELSQLKKQRYVKLNPHLLLSEYDTSIWVDGNVIVKGDLNNLLDRIIKDDCSIYVPTHPQRKCIYAETDIVVAMRKDTRENVSRQIERYKKEGFPKDFGLLQSNILVRKHNDKDCIAFMKQWFDEVKNGSHRDQLSFNYVEWKNKDIKIKYLDKNICKSEWFFWDGLHNKGKSIKQRNIVKYRPLHRGIVGNIKSKNNYTRTVAVRSDMLTRGVKIPTYNIKIY